MSAATLGSDGAHLLVVDDDARLLDLLRRFLSERGFRVTTAEDAAAARRTLKSFDVDLIVLDVMMPGEDGLALTSSLREHSEVPVLLLTAMGESSDRIAGLAHGADDYVVKPFEPEELVLRIEAILRRSHRSTAPEAVALRLGECVFDPARGELRRGVAAIRLTSSETACLRVFAASPGRTLSRQDLCTHTGAASERAVDVQVTRLRRKIEPNPKEPRYLRTVWGEGYVLWPD
jgi:two-component system phosphate regulon response regulator OmpR